MHDTEDIRIKVGISGTYWDKRPQYRISLNDTVYAEGTITAPSDTVEYYEFDVEYATDVATLKIELLNKESSDTVENEDKTGILKDMLLNIVSLEIEEIDLGQVPFDHGVFTTKMPVHWKGNTTDTIKNCLNLGWNGAWTLTWSNPFYIWLLETM